MILYSPELDEIVVLIGAWVADKRDTHIYWFAKEMFDEHDWFFIGML